MPTRSCRYARSATGSGSPRDAPAHSAVLCSSDSDIGHIGDGDIGDIGYVDRSRREALDQLLDRLEDEVSVFASMRLCAWRRAYAEVVDVIAQIRAIPLKDRDRVDGLGCVDGRGDIDCCGCLDVLGCR